MEEAPSIPQHRAAQDKSRVSSSSEASSSERCGDVSSSNSGSVGRAGAGASRSARLKHHPRHSFLSSMHDSCGSISPSKEAFKPPTAGQQPRAQVHGTTATPSPSRAQSSSAHGPHRLVRPSCSSLPLATSGSSKEGRCSLTESPRGGASNQVMTLSSECGRGSFGVVWRGVYQEHEVRVHGSGLCMDPTGGNCRLCMVHRLSHTSHTLAHTCFIQPMHQPVDLTSLSPLPVALPLSLPPFPSSPPSSLPPPHPALPPSLPGHHLPTDHPQLCVVLLDARLSATAAATATAAGGHKGNPAERGATEPTRRLARPHGCGAGGYAHGEAGAP